jgi:hypothetical protein
MKSLVNKLKINVGIPNACDFNWPAIVKQHPGLSASITRLFFIFKFVLLEQQIYFIFKLE